MSIEFAKNSPILTIGNNGGGGGGSGTLTAPQTITAPTPTTIPLTLIGATSQSEPALVYKSADGTVEFQINAQGGILVLTNQANPAIFRAIGGTAGVSEGQVYHDGTNLVLGVKSGKLLISGNAANQYGVDFYGLEESFLKRTQSNNMTFFIGNPQFAIDINQLTVLSSTKIAWSPANNTLNGLPPDTSIDRPAAGMIRVSNASSGPAGICSPGNTPTTLSTNTNNYNPGVGLFTRLSSSTSVNVTGMVAGQDGELRYIWNVGSNTITLTNQDANSTAANRWLTTTGGNLTLAANKLAIAQYDMTNSCWRVSLTGAAVAGVQTAADAATVTFDVSQVSHWEVTLGGNRTLALINVTIGQSFSIRLIQDGTGSRTVTWFSGISWPNGITPTLTATANKADVFVFVCRAANTYDGFVSGQNM